MNDAEWKVFQLTDTDWWMARTIEEAVAAAMQLYGLPRDEVIDSTAREITADELDRFTIENDDDDNEVQIRTFREELAAMVARDPTPQFFATTEY